MMQYAANFAYMEGNEVTILQPQKTAINFLYDFENKTLAPTLLNSDLSDNALAHALWGSLAYENAWYRNE
jgi:hypothetical protein